MDIKLVVLITGMQNIEDLEFATDGDSIRIGSFSGHITADLSFENVLDQINTHIEDPVLDDVYDEDYENATEGWVLDEDGNWYYNPDDAEEQINLDASAFAGIPDEDEVVIPTDVVEEVTNDITHSEAVIALGKNSGFDQRFESVEEAALKTGTRRSDILRVLRGERQSANGWIWKWEDTSIPTELPSSTAHQMHGTIYGGKPHHYSKA